MVITRSADENKFPSAQNPQFLGSRFVPNGVIPILGRHCLTVTLFRIAGVLCSFLNLILDGFGVSRDVLVGSILG